MLRNRVSGHTRRSRHICRLQDKSAHLLDLSAQTDIWPCASLGDLLGIGIPNVFGLTQEFTQN